MPSNGHESLNNVLERRAHLSVITNARLRKRTPIAVISPTSAGVLKYADSVDNPASQEQLATGD